MRSGHRMYARTDTGEYLCPKCVQQHPSTIITVADNDYWWDSTHDNCEYLYCACGGLLDTAHGDHCYNSSFDEPNDDCKEQEQCVV